MHSPLAQWSDVISSLGGLIKQAVEALNTYWTSQLGSTPETEDAAGDTYDADPNALPAVLKSGQFASSSSLNVVPFPNAIYGALASAGINTLWNEDKDFIIKISNSILGAGPGGAYKALPSMTYCDKNGVAWIFMRWNWKVLPVTRLYPCSTPPIGRSGEPMIRPRITPQGTKTRWESTDSVLKLSPSYHGGCNSSMASGQIKPLLLLSTRS